MNFTEDLDELDRIWPLGKQLVVPDWGFVLVAGAYEGRYMQYVSTRFRIAAVVGYEPQPDKAAIARERMRHSKAPFLVHDKGIGVTDCLVSLERCGTDGCRIGDLTSPSVVELESIDALLNDSPPIDLFICNMEGYEVPLLSYLCATGRIAEIKSLAVQFHSKDNLHRLTSMLTAHYGLPIYNDFPKWSYWI